MSFFHEINNDNIVLFTTTTDLDPFKPYLSKMGGTFYPELESKKGSKHPAWIFDLKKRTEVENFILERDEEEETHSVSSLPDIELLFDEIFRRLDALEKGVQELFEVVDGVQ